MIRSGSTLQYQLASSIAEHARIGHRLKYVPESDFEILLNRHQEDTGLKIVKVHVCTLTLEKLAKKSDTKVIYCHRDIRDVAVSAMRKFDMSFDALIDAGWLDQAIIDYYAWTNMPNVLVSRYDEMICNLKKEMSRISIFLGLTVNSDVLSELSDGFEIPIQKHRIEALKRRHGHVIDDSEIVFDEIELLHHNHIYKGEVDGWRQLLSPLQQSFLTERYSQWLRTLGYSFEY
jgi:hypothetical protein